MTYFMYVPLLLISSEISTYAYIFLYCVDFYGVNYFWFGNSYFVYKGLLHPITVEAVFYILFRLKKYIQLFHPHVIFFVYYEIDIQLYFFNVILLEILPCQ